MNLFDLDEIEDILQKRNQSSTLVTEVNDVVLDSRQCHEGCLFIGLVGEKTDGAMYLEDALRQGARMVILKQPQESFQALNYKELCDKYQVALFLVEDPLKALHKLAQSYVKRYPHLIKIAVTGSAGKTTVKEMITAIVSEYGNVLCNSGNLNSETGLPLSCFRIKRHHQYAVLEMGTNHPGEIAALVQIFPPDFAIVTNIGSSHVGHFGSIEAIALEKRAIFSTFTGHEMAFIPQNDHFAALLAEHIPGRVVFYSASTLKRLEHIQNMGLDGWIIYYHNQKMHLALAGRHNLHNALLAIEVGYQLGIKPAVIKAGLEKIKPLPGRSELMRGRITVFNDCYNASPEAVQAALALIAPLRYARKIAFLADMKELGDFSTQKHADLAPDIIKARFDAVFLLGSAIKALELRLKEMCFLGQIFFYTDYSTAETALLQFLKDDDLLLLKGSHSMGLQRVVPTLEQHGFLWPQVKKEVSVA